MAYVRAQYDPARGGDTMAAPIRPAVPTVDEVGTNHRDEQRGVLSVLDEPTSALDVHSERPRASALGAGHDAGI